MHTLIWALLAEVVLPAFLPWATGDALDVAVYAVGALVGGCFWHGFYRASPGFDLLAPYYSGMEFFLAGGILQRSRIQFLPAPTGTILLAGEGHGRFLEVLLARQPQASVVCLEESPRMISAARSRLRKRGLPAKNVTFLQQDILTWDPAPGQFDCIVTHFFLDCFDGPLLREVVRKLSLCAKPEATWLCADFQIPRPLLAALRARAIIWLMLRFFQFAAHLPARALEDPAPLLERSGFRLRARKEFNAGLVRAESWQRVAS